jgi:hypothetical protein
MRNSSISPFGPDHGISISVFERLIPLNLPHELANSLQIHKVRIIYNLIRKSYKKIRIRFAS